MNRLILPLVTVLLLFGCSATKVPDAVIRVDESQIIHTMKGGMGASWHAISKELPLNNEKYKYPVRAGSPRGSAYGGNPPVADTAAWNQIKNHATWLGLNFVRVELSQRMYEPERRKFDWENEEMQALYRILDWCQLHNTDVFLQQMWGYLDWNSYPGVHPLISAPKNLDDFADGIATLLEHLTKIKGYSCIKYFCMTNEPPGGPWGYWWEYGDDKGSINEAWKRLKEEFDARSIAIPVSGPDWTSMPPFQEEKLVFASYLGSIDIHSYDGVTAEGEANLKRWADWAHAQNKPFFMTEYGNMKLGYGGDNPSQKSFDAALSNATDVIRGLRAGVDGFNRWSFVNRGDLDGQWQLIQTFDRQTKQYLSQVKPENEAYYGFGILSRFLSKYSSTVSVSVNQPDSVLMSAALLSPQGELSVFIVNPTNTILTLDLGITSPLGKEMNVYQVSKEIVSRPGFELNAIRSYNSSNKAEVILPGRSITTVTSYSLKNSDQGIVFQ
ncbi:MAG TPA: cellulase family glycosylhydrolase [Prolixibacteraceae bacterium]|jgi:hypothetical protein